MNLLKFLILIFVFFASRNAVAQVIDSSFYQWSVYEIAEDEEEEKKCYIVSYPIKSSSDHNPRQKPYIMITRFEKDRSEEFSVSSGFEFKLNSEVFVLIDGHQHKLIAKADYAWARSRKEDVQIVQTMLKSAAVKVRSDSAIGTYAVDEYSLKGITLAYSRMREICK